MRKRGSEPGCKKSCKPGGAHGKNGGAHDASQLAVGRREGPQMDGYVYEKEEETSLERLAEVN